ncbi:MAG: biopolymer transporter ExbD [Thermoguttaceae bacterium]|nr:biopolymer transporter ExbD [Thermoguttaceae bacterium]MDO4856868.1 biopolymer transporter ExbD [Thermoguttaceae bacterium]
MARAKKNGPVPKGDMTPMIDMVFQLLIFFILTLNIVDPEGDFNLRLPKPGSAQAQQNDIINKPLRITLVSNTEGNLTKVWVGEKSCKMKTGTDPDEADVRAKIRAAMGGAAGSPSDFEIELGWGGPGRDTLKYRYVIKMLGICTGEKQPDGTVKTLVEKIKFIQ